MQTILVTPSTPPFALVAPRITNSHQRNLSLHFCRLDIHLCTKQKFKRYPRRPVGSVTVHSVKGGHSSLIPWPLSQQRAYSSSHVVALSHVGGMPHLSPRVLPFAPAIQAAPNCMGCYSFIDRQRMEG